MSKQNEQAIEDLAVAQSVVLVNPDDLMFDPDIYALRDRETASYKKYITGLAQEIRDFGQRQPVILRPHEDGLSMILIAGQCRADAVSSLRRAGVEISLKAIIESDIDEDSAYRVAIVENEKRRDFTPLERARMYGAIRVKFGWDGKNGTKQLAEYLQVSEATVTQVEKALGLPDDVKAKLEDGTMNLYGALELLNTPEPKRKAVVEKAGELAKREADEKAEKEAKASAKKGKRVGSVIGTDAGVADAGPQTSATASEAGSKGVAKGKGSTNAPSAPQDKPKITGTHVKAAQKELGVQTKLRAPRMIELRAWAEANAGPGNPAVVVKFLQGLISWSEAKLSDKKLTALLDDLADVLPASEKAKKVAAKPAEKLVKVKAKAAVKVAAKATKPKVKAAAKAAAKKTKVVAKVAATKAKKQAKK